jgi:hypothetical protein
MNRSKRRWRDFSARSRRTGSVPTRATKTARRKPGAGRVVWPCAPKRSWRPIRTPTRTMFVTRGSCWSNRRWNDCEGASSVAGPQIFSESEIGLLCALLRRQVKFMAEGLSSATLQGAPAVTQVKSPAAHPGSCVRRTSKRQRPGRCTARREGVRTIHVFPGRSGLGRPRRQSRN